MRTLINRRVQAPDGITLATDVYLPSGPGPFPVVFMRTPYGKTGKISAAKRFVNKGYAFVIQDIRGKFDSDGYLCPPDEGMDGGASLDWIGNERWCNGRIGMVGLSYHGIVQIPAAASGHGALKCIAPGVAPNNFFTDWIRYDGCFALANAIRWGLVTASQRTRVPDELFDWHVLNNQPSLDALFEKAGCCSESVRRWVEHDVEDEYWRGIDQERMYDDVKVPGLHQAGWFDHISRGQFSAFNGVKAAPQCLLAAPWQHEMIGTRSGDWEFGAEAEFSRESHEERFLDLWLRDIDDGISEEPPVKLFILGENRWESFSSWPPSGVSERCFYFHEPTAPGTGQRGGRLLESTPNVDVSPDRYSSDPTDPVPSRGGPIYRLIEPNPIGPVDQRPLIARDDLLFYRGETFSSPVMLAGEPVLDCWFASDAEDTDIIVKLCVEEPSGRVIVLSVGSLRLRYREGWDRCVALPKGEPVNVKVRLHPVTYVFPEGSRVCCIVAGSSFPRILPHPNTMAPTWKETCPVVANNQILRDAQHPSRMCLPML